METNYDIFISFKNSDKDGKKIEDRELAYKLYKFLKSKNLKIFFSEATLQELGADSWGDEIENALRASKIFIALGTKEEYFYTYWLQKERTTFLTLKSLDKSKALYSYIASPMTTNNLPEDIKGLECFEDSKPNEFERIYSFISNHLSRYFQRLKDNEFLDKEIANPYKGLFHFTYQDRKNYFGREKESKEIAKILKESRFFTLLGASGSGKSSLLFAGVLPLLKDSLESECLHPNKTRLKPSIPNQKIEILDFRPQDRPFRNLANIFIPMLYPDKLIQAEKKEELTDKLQNGKIKLENLIELYFENQKIDKLYIIIDQFEELFTLTKDSKIKNHFLDQLLSLIESNLEITLIVSLRADFLSFASYYELLNHAINQNPKTILGLMSQENLQRAIELPAKNLGVEFEKGLVERILKEISNQAGQLPLLEFALEQFWQKMNNRVITHKSLDEMGSISHAISYHADMIYKKHIKNQEAIRRVFLKLVNREVEKEDVKYTRRLATFESFDESDRDVISLLATERLIVTKENSVEVVHEALLREWSLLKKWTTENREFLEWEKRTRIDIEFYQQNGKNKEDLLQDGKLFIAKDFLKNYRKEASEFKDFIDKSIQVQKQRDRKKRIILGGVFVSLLVVIGLIGYFWKTSERQRNIAREAQVETQSLLFENTLQQGISYKENSKNYDNLLKAKSIFAKAISRSTNKTQENKSKLLYKSINNPIRLEKNLPYNTKGLVFDKNRETFLSLEKNKVVLFNLQTNKKRYIIEHNTSVKEAFLSKDENEVLSWDNHTIKIWNKNSNTIQNSEYRENIERVIFSKNRKIVVTLGEGNSTIWNREKNIFFNLEHNSSIEWVCFNDDEKFVLSWDNKIIKIWDIDTSKLIRSFEVQKDDSIENVVFDTTGNILIYRHKDEDDISIRAYNIKTGKKKFETKGYFLGFNKDKRKFITVENQENGTFEIKDTQTGLKINSLSNAGYTISHFIFNKKMNSILLVNNQIFNIDGAEVQLKYLDNEYIDDIKIEYPKSYVIDAFLTPNEKYIISWSPQEIIIFDIENNKIISSLKNNEPIEKVVFNQKRNQIISWSKNSIKFWSIIENKKILNLNKYETHSDYDIKYTKNGKGMFFRRNEIYTMLDNKEDEELQKIAEDYYDYTVKFGDLTNNEIIPIIQHKARVNGIVLSDDETQLLSYSEDNTSKLFDLKRKKILFTLKHNSISNVNFSKNGKYILSWSSDGLIILWNRKNGKKILELKDNSNNKNNFFNRSFGVNISEDSKQIYSFSGKNIIIWDIKTKKQEFNFKEDGYILEKIYNHKHYNIIQGAILNSDNTKIAFWYNTGVLNSEYMLYVWDIKNKKKLMSYKFKKINNAIFNKNSNKILSWNNDNIYLFDTYSGKKLINFKKNNLDHYSEIKLKFDKKEKLVFEKRDNMLIIWDVETGELLFETEDNREIIWNNTDLFLSKIYNKQLDKKDYSLKMEVELGIYLNKSREIKALTTEEWEEKRYKKAFKENEKIY